MLARGAIGLPILSHSRSGVWISIPVFSAYSSTCDTAGAAILVLIWYWQPSVVRKLAGGDGHLCAGGGGGGRASALR
jgi:hypothetical protein